jgi:hypothetical protein
MAVPRDMIRGSSCCSTRWGAAEPTDSTEDARTMPAAAKCGACNERITYCEQLQVPRCPHLQSVDALRRRDVCSSIRGHVFPVRVEFVILVGLRVGLLGNGRVVAAVLAISICSTISRAVAISIYGILSSCSCRSTRCRMRSVGRRSRMVISNRKCREISSSGGR